MAAVVEEAMAMAEVESGDRRVAAAAEEAMERAVVEASEAVAMVEEMAVMTVVQMVAWPAAWVMVEAAMERVAAVE
jgi:hypothetical protein